MCNQNSYMLTQCVKLFNDLLQLDPVLLSSSVELGNMIKCEKIKLYKVKLGIMYTTD